MRNTAGRTRARTGHTAGGHTAGVLRGATLDKLNHPLGQSGIGDHSLGNFGCKLQGCRIDLTRLPGAGLSAGLGAGCRSPSGNGGLYQFLWCRQC